MPCAHGTLRPAPSLPHARLRSPCNWISFVALLLSETSYPPFFCWYNHSRRPHVRWLEYMTDENTPPSCHESTTLLARQGQSLKRVVVLGTLIAHSARVSDPGDALGHADGPRGGIVRVGCSVQTTCTLDEPAGSVIRLQRKIFTSLILNPNSYNSHQGRVVYKLVDLLEISRVWVKTSK